MSDAKTLAREYLKESFEFRLGDLVTEQSNPITQGLSNLAVMNLPLALEKMRQVDLNMLEALKEKADELEPLRLAIADTLEDGGRIFLCGCGATGRLSLALENLWRENQRETSLCESVVGFMAGGDVALISSIEKFEDYPDYGSRQLIELGFGENDLLISSTEGGETPFVIGATETATEVSKRAPFFLYCNPDDILKKVALRSKNVIENNKIVKINLSHGPQALMGSTRMQASSILMFGIGLCLECYSSNMSVMKEKLKDFYRKFLELDLKELIPFIEEETGLYQQGAGILYQSDESLGISVLTDTTERSPTFSLLPFENQLDSDISPSLCHLYFPQEENEVVAWKMLLKRNPRTLEWDGIGGVASLKRLHGFDFSKNLLDRRNEYSLGQQHRFRILHRGDELLFHLGHHRTFFDLSGKGNLEAHLLLKMLLNMHSTLVMGRMGRYQSNIMTWVRPSNNKLIDRTIRYADQLLKEKGKEAGYEELALATFTLMETTPRNQSLVMALVNYFLSI